jgi:hypothetical protein
VTDTLPALAAVPEPLDAVLERAIASLVALGELGERIQDEWQYVNDLVRIHTADLRALAAADPRPVDPASARAVDLAIEEAGLVTDPHRAIDWISTFPQIVRLALETRA